MDNRILPAAYDPGQIPGSLLPNPGEGGPVYPGDMQPSPIPPQPPIVIQPLPQQPSIALPNASVRFVNATHGYPPLRIAIEGTRVVTLLSSGEASCPSRIRSGSRTFSVLGTDGYVYIEKTLRLRAGMRYLLVIANRNGGIDLTAVPDNCS